MTITDTTVELQSVAVGATTPGLAPGIGRWRTVRGFGGRILSTVISIAVVLLAWQLFLKLLHVNSFIGRGPLDVWRYLTSNAAARAQLWHASVTTLRDAGVGLAAGTVAALVCAVIFNLARSVEQTLLPIALVLSSVPLVAMTPLIALIFGRGLMGVTVIAGIVTFFPTLVNVTLALRRTPEASIDLCHAYGADRFLTLRKVQFPSALPALFASLRIAAPLALVGALLAEWLATGKGLGYLMLQSQTLSNYGLVWSSVAAVTAYSFGLYTVISWLERLVLDRFGSLPT
ncbi:MAG: binding-protein-dependent transport system inner rane component [Actinomycetia bacterium]|nr:binding-protein-dependent transport system inner rane component [Actinomycetes bacterium]